MAVTDFKPTLGPLRTRTSAASILTGNNAAFCAKFLEGRNKGPRADLESLTYVLPGQNGEEARQGQQPSVVVNLLMQLRASYDQNNIYLRAARTAQTQVTAQLHQALRQYSGAAQAQAAEIEKAIRDRLFREGELDRALARLEREVKKNTVSVDRPRSWLGAGPWSEGSNRLSLGQRVFRQEPPALRGRGLLGDPMGRGALPRPAGPRQEEKLRETALQGSTLPGAEAVSQAHRIPSGSSGETLTHLEREIGPAGTERVPKERGSLPASEEAQRQKAAPSSGKKGKRARKKARRRETETVPVESQRSRTAVLGEIRQSTQLPQSMTAGWTVLEAAAPETRLIWMPVSHGDVPGDPVWRQVWNRVLHPVFWQAFAGRGGGAEAGPRRFVPGGTLRRRVPLGSGAAWLPGTAPMNGWGPLAAFFGADDGYLTARLPAQSGMAERIVYRDGLLQPIGPWRWTGMAGRGPAQTEVPAHFRQVLTQAGDEENLRTAGQRMEESVPRTGAQPMPAGGTRAVSRSISDAEVRSFSYVRTIRHQTPGWTFAPLLRQLIYLGTSGQSGSMAESAALLGQAPGSIQGFLRKGRSSDQKGPILSNGSPVYTAGWPAVRLLPRFGGTWERVDYDGAVPPTEAFHGDAPVLWRQAPEQRDLKVLHRARKETASQDTRQESAQRVEPRGFPQVEILPGFPASRLREIWRDSGARFWRTLLQRGPASFRTVLARGSRAVWREVTERAAGIAGTELLTDMLPFQNGFPDWEDAGAFAGRLPGQITRLDGETHEPYFSTTVPDRGSLVLSDTSDTDTDAGAVPAVRLLPPVGTAGETVYREVQGLSGAAGEGVRVTAGHIPSVRRLVGKSVPEIFRQWIPQSASDVLRQFPERGALKSLLWGISQSVSGPSWPRQPESNPAGPRWEVLRNTADTSWLGPARTAQEVLRQMRRRDEPGISRKRAEQSGPTGLRESGESAFVQENEERVLPSRLDNAPAAKTPPWQGRGPEEDLVLGQVTAWARELAQGMESGSGPAARSTAGPVLRRARPVYREAEETERNHTAVRTGSMRQEKRRPSSPLWRMLRQVRRETNRTTSAAETFLRETWTREHTLYRYLQRKNGTVPSMAESPPWREAVEEAMIPPIPAYREAGAEMAGASPVTVYREAESTAAPAAVREAKPVIVYRNPAKPAAQADTSGAGVQPASVPGELEGEAVFQAQTLPEGQLRALERAYSYQAPGSAPDAAPEGGTAAESTAPPKAEASINYNRLTEEILVRLERRLRAERRKFGL